jgi:hypothetical protein
VLQFMRLLWANVHQLQRRSKRMTAELGGTGPQQLVLAGRRPHSPAPVSQRLLRRSSNEDDRRRSKLYLTPRGELVNSTARGTVESAIAAALQVIGHADAAVTARALAVIAEHLEAPTNGLRRRPRAAFPPGIVRRLRCEGGGRRPRRAGRRSCGGG